MTGTTGPRDRDATGRAANARPRDELGRPLPYGSPGVERVPEGFVLPPAQALVEAQRLLDAGRPFHAHEVLEGSWKAAPDPERELWQGLAQLCVGLTHLARGNARGARALLQRAADRIAAYAAQPPHAVAVAELVTWARATAASPVPLEAPLPRLQSATRLLLVSGSTRAGSTNVAALRTLAALLPTGVHAELFDDLAGLPAFNPDDDLDPLPAPVLRLRGAIEAADAVLISTPEYAGTLPGAFKNLLDWTVGGTSFTDRPTAWVNVAAPGRGDGAVETLRLVLGYVGAHLVEPACRRVPVLSAQVGPDGIVADDEVRRGLGEVLQALLDEVRARRG